MLPYKYVLKILIDSLELTNRDRRNALGIRWDHQTWGP